MLHELRAAGRAGGEVVQQRVGRERLGMQHPLGGRAERLVVVGPALRAVSHPYTRHPLRQEVELVDVVAGRDHMRDRTAHDAVLQVVASDGQRRGEDDGADLGEGEHRLPELDLVAEHQQDRIALAHSPPEQPVAELVGAGRQLVERPGGALAVLLEDHQRGRRVVARDLVEPVDRPVEGAVDLGPGELRTSGRVVLAQRDELIARGAETFCGRADGHGLPHRRKVGGHRSVQKRASADRTHEATFAPRPRYPQRPGSASSGPQITRRRPRAPDLRVRGTVRRARRDHPASVRSRAPTRPTRAARRSAAR